MRTCWVDEEREASTATRGLEIYPEKYDRESLFTSRIFSVNVILEICGGLSSAGFSMRRWEFTIRDSEFGVRKSVFGGLRKRE